METALSAPVFTLFYALRLVLPARTITMVDGAGFVAFDGATWTGSDAVAGSLSALEVSGDGIALEAPTLKLTFLPPDEAAAAALCDPANQGARVELFEGLVDPQTGAVVPDPDLKFLGEFDFATLRVGKGARRVEVEVVSIWDRLFDQEEAARQSDAFHQAIHPGELGFALIPSVSKPPVWGADAPRPVAGVVSDSGFPMGPQYAGTRYLGGD
jgi:hypothetical protein